MRFEEMLQISKILQNFGNVSTKKLQKWGQRQELKTQFFAFFWKNPKVATFDFLQKIQENRVL